MNDISTSPFPIQGDPPHVLFLLFRLPAFFGPLSFRRLLRTALGNAAGIHVGQASNPVLSSGMGMEVASFQQEATCHLYV